MSVVTFASSVVNIIYQHRRGLLLVVHLLLLLLTTDHLDLLLLLRHLSPHHRRTSSLLLNLLLTLLKISRRSSGHGAAMLYDCFADGSIVAAAVADDVAIGPDGIVVKQLIAAAAVLMIADYDLVGMR